MSLDEDILLTLSRASESFRWPFALSVLATSMPRKEGLSKRQVLRWRRLDTAW